MLTHPFQRCLLIFLSVGLVTLLLACGQATTANQNQDATSPAAQAESLTTTVAMPSTQTACPTPGKGRAAVLAPLEDGSDQNIIYTSNTSSTGAIKRYDVQKSEEATIVSLPHVKISDAQVSIDGHFVLFLSQVG